ncbi:MAG: hypothetical protein AAGC60_16065 [Acidobacteriota bacterium]
MTQTPGRLGRLLARLGLRRRKTADARPMGYDLLGELDHDLDPSLLPPARQQVAHASLLESLRALETAMSVPTVVIAGVKTAESARPTIAGVIIQAHLSGHRLSLAKLVRGSGFRVLRKRVPHADTLEGTRVPLLGEATEDGRLGSHPDDHALRLIGAPDPEAVTRWYREHAEGYDLLLVEAPAMLQSVDAALLGRLCDGLILVVDSMGTRQEDLETAVEKARAAGCPPIGIVVQNHREWLPRVLRKILPAYPRILRKRPATGSR